MAGSRLAAVRRSASGQHAPNGAAPHSGRRPGLKLWLFGTVVLSLGVILGVALSREIASPAAPAVERPALATPRPALTPAEEAYAQALWPIHNQVKSSAIKMTLAGITFKTGGADVQVLSERVEEAAGAFQRADGQLRSLQPPSSMQAYHEQYSEAVRLYRASATEMLQVVRDGDDQHLVAAFPLSQEGGLKLRQVGAALWPGEYVPN
jgi:hypothetical protein